MKIYTRHTQANAIDFISYVVKKYEALRRTPEELSREFEPSAQSIWNWVRQAVETWASARTAFAALLDRMQGFRLASGHPEPKVEPSLILRSLPKLWIEFEQRG